MNLERKTNLIGARMKENKLPKVSSTEKFGSVPPVNCELNKPNNWKEPDDMQSRIWYVNKCKAHRLKHVSHRLAVICSRRSWSWTILHPQEVTITIRCTHEEVEPIVRVMNHMVSLSTEKTTPKRQKKSMSWYWVRETWYRKIVSRHMTNKSSSKWSKIWVSMMHTRPTTQRTKDTIPLEEQ